MIATNLNALSKRNLFLNFKQIRPNVNTFNAFVFSQPKKKKKKPIVLKIKIKGNSFFPQLRLTCCRGYSSSWRTGKPSTSWRNWKFPSSSKGSSLWRSSGYIFLSFLLILFLGLWFFERNRWRVFGWRKSRRVNLRKNNKISKCIN